MLIEVKRIKPNDGSFKGGYTVKQTTSRSSTPKVIVVALGGGDYMCLDGHHRVELAAKASQVYIECEVVPMTKEILAPAPKV